MTPSEIGLIWMVALPLAGVIVRGHFPRLWPFLAPILGATGQPPAAAPAAQAQAHALAHYERGQRPGLDEEELHYQLAMYVAKEKTAERLKTMLASAHATACQKTGSGPAPSAN